eukprot:CAMPEP_0174925322 /NCGR_PEP_ID=MMETSP1355-20121228/7833_1 /TAXON_ID=464990 /ORGANISM="Hemiselmis tepida, Strain CCMP443" /LENGTH=75 /DNA_ID=CAMNT_0016171219 /DNA_START=226 /DNA_END=449 /DNA_ORIENTATION=-
MAVRLAVVHLELALGLGQHRGVRRLEVALSGDLVESCQGVGVVLLHLLEDAADGVGRCEECGKHRTAGNSQQDPR